MTKLMPYSYLEKPVTEEMPGGRFEYGLALIDKSVQEDDFRAGSIVQKGLPTPAEIAISCTALGSMYDEGRGVPQDQTKAVALYQRACEGGAPAGCNSLGSMYGEGRVVSRDLTKSMDLFRKACEGGYAMGCSNLGLGYAQGKGVKQDYFQAVDLFRKACEGRYAIGCTDLGIAYQAGIGVRQNNAEALKYFGKACDLKDEEGCGKYAKLNALKYRKVRTKSWGSS